MRNPHRHFPRTNETPRYRVPHEQPIGVRDVISLAIILTAITVPVIVAINYLTP